MTERPTWEASRDPADNRKLHRRLVGGSKAGSRPDQSWPGCSNTSFSSLPAPPQTGLILGPGEGADGHRQRPPRGPSRQSSAPRPLPTATLARHPPRHGRSDVSRLYRTVTCLLLPTRLEVRQAAITSTSRLRAGAGPWRPHVTEASARRRARPAAAATAGHAVGCSDAASESK